MTRLVSPWLLRLVFADTGCRQREPPREALVGERMNDAASLPRVAVLYALVRPPPRDDHRRPMARTAGARCRPAADAEPAATDGDSGGVRREPCNR